MRRSPSAAAVLALGALAGCAPSEWTVVLAYTHNANGRLEPCSCPGNPLGGFPRRGAAFERLRAMREPVLFVDGGDIAPWEDDPLAASYAFTAGAFLKYDAVVPGERDLFWHLGRQLEHEQTEPPWVCANLAQAGGGRIGRPWGIRELSGKRIATVGLVGESCLAFLPPEKRLRYDWIAPGRAFAAAHARLRRHVDLTVVLFHGDVAEASAAAARFPGTGVLLAGHGTERIESPGRSGGYWILQAGENGEHVGVAHLRVRDGEVSLVSNRFVPLSPALPDEPDVAGVVARFRQADQERWDEEIALSRDPNPMAAPAGCRSCHPAQHAQWKTTAHAHAVATLARAGREKVPACLRCHTTETDLETRPLPDVSCMACHAVSLEPEAHGKFEPTVAEAGPDLCGRCHTPERSPRFRYRTALAKVRH